MTESAETLGQRLKRIREDRGITRRFVAQACGFDVSNLSNIELTKQTPTLDTLRTMARLFRCSIDELTDVGAPLPPGPLGQLTERPAARDTLPLDYVPSVADAPPPGDEDESELPTTGAA